MTIRKYLTWTAVLVIGAAALAVALEIAGNLYVNMRFGKPGKIYGIFESDPELRMVPKPNSFNTRTSLNNYGFRNTENVTEQREPGTLRVLVVGGSTTHGINLTDADTYTAKLQKKLRQVPGYEKAEVWNAGVICYSAGHNLILTKRLLPKLKPDYVIIFEGVNERLNSWVMQSLDKVDLGSLNEYGVIGKNYSQAGGLMERSILLKFASWFLIRQVEKFRAHKVILEERRNSPEADPGEPHPWTVRNFDYLLREMIRAVRAGGAEPLVIRFASHRRPDLRKFSDMSLQIAQEEAAPFLDAKKLFLKSGISPRELFIYTGVHVTPAGSELLAAGLFDKLMELESRKKAAA